MGHTPKQACSRPSVHGRTSDEEQFVEEEVRKFDGSIGATREIKRLNKIFVISRHDLQGPLVAQGSSLHTLSRQESSMSDPTGQG